MPRISCDINHFNDNNNHFDSANHSNIQDTHTYVVRKEFVSTAFREDPQLANKRSKEIEMLNQLSTSEPEEIIPPPTFIRKLYVPPPPEIECTQSKKLTKSQISQLIDRLSPQNDNTNNEKAVKQSIQTNLKKSSNNSTDMIEDRFDGVFQRLYYESTQNGADDYREYDYKNSHNFTIEDDETELLTKSIALQKINKMIESAFENKQEITKAELSEIFFQLGIIDNCQSIDTISVITNIMPKWEINQHSELFDAIKIQNTLMQAVIGRKGKFKQYARERMALSLANRKFDDSKITNPKFESCHSARRMTQETFDRLLSPRPDFSSKSQQDFDPKDYVKFQLSPETKKIIKMSPYANSKLEERDKDLCEKAMRKVNDIRKQMEKERIKMQSRQFSQNAPEITPEDRQKIEALKKKRELAKETEKKPTYKPDIMKYEDFLVLKQSMKEEIKRPYGMDSFLERMKKGHELSEKKKSEEESIRQLPRLPKKKTIKIEPIVLEPVIEEPLPPPPVEETTKKKPQKKTMKSSKSKISSSTKTPK